MPNSPRWSFSPQATYLWNKLFSIYKSWKDHTSGWYSPGQTTVKAKHLLGNKVKSIKLTWKKKSWKCCPHFLRSLSFWQYWCPHLWVVNISLLWIAASYSSLWTSHISHTWEICGLCSPAFSQYSTKKYIYIYEFTVLSCQNILKFSPHLPLCYLFLSLIQTTLFSL